MNSDLSITGDKLAFPTNMGMVYRNGELLCYFIKIWRWGGGMGWECFTSIFGGIDTFQKLL